MSTEESKTTEVKEGLKITPTTNTDKADPIGWSRLAMSPEKAKKTLLGYPILERAGGNEVGLLTMNLSVKDEEALRLRLLDEYLVTGAFAITELDAAASGGAASPEWNRRLALSDARPIFFPTPRPLTAADVVWNEHDGEIVCECDDDNCFERIRISHQDYLVVCGDGGYNRITSLKCGYGIVGYALVARVGKTASGIEDDLNIWRPLEPLLVR